MDKDRGKSRERQEDKGAAPHRTGAKIPSHHELDSTKNQMSENEAGARGNTADALARKPGKPANRQR